MFNRYVWIVAQSLFALTISTSAYSAPVTRASLEGMEDRINEAQSSVSSIEKELSSTQAKRDEAEQQLSALKQELTQKREDLQRLRASYGDSPSSAQEDIIANEQRRIALAELSIKSRSAAVERLERKENELIEALRDTQKNIDKTRDQLAGAKQALERQERAKAKALQEEMAALKRENERLRLEREQEAIRAQQAQEEMARLAQIAREKELQALKLQKSLESQDEGSTEVLASAVNDTEDAEVDMSTVVLPGEEPIYQGEDGEEIVMRSRSIEDPITLIQTGPNRFEGEVKVDPGRAYFDLRKRRYRGYFEPKKSGHYRFTYDLSDEEQPVLSVLELKKDREVVSNADEF